MEKSMKRVEKLVHATNSALAQMKFSLMFDEGPMGGEKSFGRAEASEPRFCLEGEELKQCQDEFRAEANEMLAKMEKMFGSSDPNRKKWTPLDRIKEINRKMGALRQDHPKLRETEQSSEKLVSLLAEEKLSPQKTSLRAKPPTPLKREIATPKRPAPSRSPVKPKEELRSRILETQEVVDRGFQTARHLAQRVENMARKEKASSEANQRSLDGRSESNETEKSEKASRRSSGEQKSEGSVGQGRRCNARVVEVKGRDSRRRRRPHLRVERLPSVDIRGGLQLQKVHSLEIPGGGVTGVKANTGIRILSHEEIERAKIEGILDGVRRERGSCVECTNCGKVMRVQETWVDPRRLDEVLRKCRFNVFDPRIDEFVEKHGGADGCKACERRESEGGREGESAGDSEEEGKGQTKRAVEQPKATKSFSLEDLSRQLSSKYRQEAEDLEGHHLRLSSLLKSLLRKIDESREAFEECHLLRSGRAECERVLTVTEPLVVSLTGSSPGSRSKRKLDKRDVSNRSKSRTERRESAFGEGRRRKGSVERKRRNENKERASRRKETVEERQKVESPASTSSVRSWSSSQAEAAVEKANMEEESVTELRIKAKAWESKEEGKATGVTSTASSASSSSGKEGFGACTVEGEKSPEASLAREETKSPRVSEEEKALSEASTEGSENNYESDFESFTNEPEEAEPGVIPSGKKLSTISEVDSELERKLSDEQKTHTGSHGSNPTIFDIKGTTPETSVRSTPTELITSLREVLSALKDQFARTETLAEKLTENAKQERQYSPSEEEMPSPWKMPADRLVDNLRSARRDPTGGAKTASGGVSAESLSDEGGSSLGEVIAGGQRKCGPEGGRRRSPWLSSARKEALNENSEEGSYSEGEIPRNMVLESERCSSRSIGEIRD